jgi:hypothetical protein
MITRGAFQITAAASVLAVCTVASGQANCALRNPDRQIYELFPEATSYRTVCAPVNDTIRPALEARLGSPLARTDTGVHTAYLVLNEGVPLGIVHARTENGRRGSVELVWAMDLDLTLKDFRVQRSRERQTDAIRSPAFRRNLLGRDSRGLRELMTQNNDDVNLSALDMPPDVRSLTHTVVLCALKTILITELAFRDSLGPGRMLGSIHAAFPGTVSVNRLKDPLGEPVASEMARSLGGAPTQIDPESLTFLRAIGAEDLTLGALVVSRWLGHASRPETWWAISVDGVIRDIRLVGDVDRTVDAEFSSIRGRSAGELDGTDAASRCAREVLSMSAAHGFGE